VKTPPRHRGQVSGRESTHLLGTAPSEKKVASAGASRNLADSVAAQI
jgi:hypothetical protein